MKLKAWISYYVSLSIGHLWRLQKIIGSWIRAWTKELGDCLEVCIESKIIPGGWKKASRIINKKFTFEIWKLAIFNDAQFYAIC